MSYQRLGECGIWLPNELGANPSSSSSSALSVTNGQVALIGQIVTPGYGTKTINKVHWLPESLTSAGGSTLRVSLQDWDTVNGVPNRPDGGVDQYRTQNINTVTVSAWNSTGLITADGTDGGAKRSVNNGDRLCVVWDFTSYAGADAVSIGVSTIGWFPTWGDHTATYNGTTWTGNAGVNPGVIFFEFSDGTYGSFINPTGRLGGSLSLRSDTTPDELGNKFVLPFNAKIAGVWCAYTGDTNDLEIILYDGTTPMSGGTVAIDKDTFVDGAVPRRLIARFATPVAVQAGQTYRWAIKPGGTTSAQTHYTTWPNNASMETAPGGKVMHYTSRTDAGAWSETSDRRVWGGLIIGEIECGGHANFQLGV